MKGPRFDSAPIFIGGDGRSGTTLLSVVLDSHPQLAVGPELHFNGATDLGPYVLTCLELLVAEDPRAFGAGLKENPQYKLGVQFAKRCHRFGVTFPELQELIQREMRASGTDLSSFADRCRLIEAIGESRRAARGADRWGIKIMREIKAPDRYLKIWPRAQFVHIIRDGRDVAASQMGGRGTWGYDQIETAAKGWAGLIKDTRRRSSSAPMLEVRYEDVVEDPETVTRRLADFLDVPWDPALLAHSTQAHDFFDNPYNHPSIKQAVQPINDSAVGRYAHDLTPEQIAKFEKVAGELLDELGYARGA